MTSLSEFRMRNPAPTAAKKFRMRNFRDAVSHAKPAPVRSAGLEPESPL
jgi:hypothetical protein